MAQDSAVTRKNLDFVASYPSPMLRMGPLPIRFADREDDSGAAVIT